MPRARVLAAFVCVLACRSTDRAPQDSSTIAQDVISDAAHNSGTPGFYFLPPMVPRPAAFGPLRPDVQPVVRIDRVALSPAGCTSDCIATILQAGVAQWTRVSGSDGQRIKLHLTGSRGDDDDPRDTDDGVPEGYFSVSWDSDDFGVTLHGIYRASVLVPSNGGLLLLGFADIEVVRNQKEFKNVDRTEFTPLLDGRTLKIKFRIDTPALACVDVTCTALDECHSAGVCDPHVGACTQPPMASGVACTDDQNPCTHDICDGNGACVHPPGNAGTTCRAAAGVCDVAAACTGTSADCPPNFYLAPTTVCRAAAGLCDLAENCTGSSAFCPPDAKSLAVCRSSAGVCDVAESCDGVSNDCPADAFKASTTECRASAGVCDVGAACTGTSADCPANFYLPATTVCRAAAGLCDLAENCTGSSTFCPPDAKSLAVCRSSAGVCDVPESCDGMSNDCPADAFKPDGMACGSSSVCSSSQCITACVPNQSCTPSGSPELCRKYATTCNTTLTQTTCSVQGNENEGASCGTGLVCDASGSCITACVAEQGCTPAGPADPCKVYQTVCNPTLTQTTCEVGSNATDGTVCGSGLTCRQGLCTSTSAVALTVVANPDPVARSNNVTGANGLVFYELSVGNVGGVPLANVALTDTTPNASTALLPASSGAPTCGPFQSCPAGVTVSWPVFGLEVGEVRRFRLVTQVSGAIVNGTVIHNAAAVSFAGGTLAKSRDIISSEAAGLRLGLEEDRDPVVPGADLTYTIVLANTATQGLPASGQGVLSATIPVGTTLALASTGFALVGGTVQWSFASVAPGAAQRFSYTVTVGNDVPAGTVLQATAQAQDGAASLVRAQAATEVRAAVPLVLTVSANPDPIAPANNVIDANGLMTYEYRVSNLGNATVSNVVLSHLARNDATAFLSSSTGGPSCGGAQICFPGAVVTWPSFSLAPHESQTFRHVTRVSGIVGINGFVHSTATVTSSAGQLIRGTDVVGSGAAGLRLGLEEDRDPVIPGADLSYTIVLANTSTQALPASGQGVLSATIPPGTTLASASTGFALVGSTVQWSFASVAPGAAQRFSYTVTVGNAFPDGTVLQATAQAQDGAASLVRAQAATEVRAAPLVRVTLAAAPDPAANLGMVMYTATVTNTAAAPLVNIGFAEQTTERANVILATSTPGGSCGGATVCGPGQFVIWPLFNLSVGQSQTFTWTAQIIGAPAGIVIDSNAIATVGGGIVRQGRDIVVR